MASCRACEQRRTSLQACVSLSLLVSKKMQCEADKPAIVQASTCCGYDSACSCKSTARFPHRRTAVGSVDVLQPNAPKSIRHWVERGTNGFRLFTGGSRAAFDPSTLDDPRSFPTWQLTRGLELPVANNGSSSVGLRLAGKM